MSRERHHLAHARVLPHDDLVLAEPVRANDLIAVFAPRKIADLTPRVDFIDHGAGERVPELDRPIDCSASACQRPVLMRRPRDCFHRRCVIGEFVEGRFGEFIPDEELVVVAAGGELAVFAVPFETADFAFVACEFGDVLVGGADVAVVDGAVAGAGGEDVVVPGEGADAGGVTGHGPEAAAFARVPDLHVALVGADGDVGALRAVSKWRGGGGGGLRTRWIQDTLVTVSSWPRSQSLVTLPELEFHMYTHEPRPTPRMLVLPQSTRLR